RKRRQDEDRNIGLPGGGLGQRGRDVRVGILRQVPAMLFGGPDGKDDHGVVGKQRRDFRQPQFFPPAGAARSARVASFGHASSPIGSFFRPASLAAQAPRVFALQSP